MFTVLSVVPFDHIVRPTGSGFVAGAGLFVCLDAVIVAGAGEFGAVGDGIRRPKLAVFAGAAPPVVILVCHEIFLL